MNVNMYHFSGLCVCVCFPSLVFVEADGEGKQRKGRSQMEVSVLGFSCILTVRCVFLADGLDTTGLFSRYCILSGRSR